MKLSHGLMSLLCMVHCSLSQDSDRSVASALSVCISQESEDDLFGLGHAKAVQIENMQSLICTIQKWQLQWSSGPFDGLIFFIFWEVSGSRN